MAEKRRVEEIQNRRLYPRRRWRLQRADWLWRLALQFLPARGWPALPCPASPCHAMSCHSLQSLFLTQLIIHLEEERGGGAATQGTGARASVGHAHPFLFWRTAAARAAGLPHLMWKRNTV